MIWCAIMWARVGAIGILGVPASVGCRPTWSRAVAFAAYSVAYSKQRS